VRVNEQFGRSRLANPLYNEIFFDPSSQQLFCPRAQEHPMRVRGDREHTAPSSCGVCKKVTNNEYRPIKYLEKFSKEGS
jgi:hypothetical protein